MVRGDEVSQFSAWIKRRPLGRLFCVKLLPDAVVAVPLAFCRGFGVFGCPRFKKVRVLHAV